MNIARYTKEKSNQWNEFVAKSKNGTFLFDRNYMEYHSDRFDDFSLMFYNNHDKLCAIMPANKVGKTLYSHQGLTYGGLVTNDKTTIHTVIDCFSSLMSLLKVEHFNKLIYKATPHIYHLQPSEEDLYALFTICNARLSKRDISSALPLSHPISFTESRRSGLRKAHREGLTVAECDDIAGFWNILEANLMSRHGVSPVHSAAEMQLLKSRFPSHIRLFCTFKDGVIVGGTLLYLSQQVVHTQYISASEQGKRSGAIDLLFDYLIKSDLLSHYSYLDFGKSNENDCFNLNNNLIFQKEGFGGRAVCYDTYTIDIDSPKPQHTEVENIP